MTVSWDVGGTNLGLCRLNVAPVRITSNVLTSTIVTSTTHNGLAGLQGGTTAEYYHATSAEYAVLQATSGTNTGNQTITLTSDVTGSGTGSFATTIAAKAVTLAKMDDMATASLIYRKTAATGVPEVNTLATLKTDLGLSGSNSGDNAANTSIAATKIDDLTAGDDNTDLDSNTTRHGLLLKATAPASTMINVVGIGNAETAYTNKALFDATTPSTQAFGDAAAVGTAVVAARRDHKHAMMAAPTTVTGSAGSVKSNATTGVMQIAGPATGTTRVMTVPDADFTAVTTATLNGGTLPASVTTLTASGQVGFSGTSVSTTPGIRLAATNYVVIRGGSAGTAINNNADTASLMYMTDAGAVSIPGSLGSGTFTATTSANAINFVIGANNLNGTQASTNAVGMGFLNEANGLWWKAGIVHERTGGYGVGNLHFLNSNAVDNSTVTLADSRLKIATDGAVSIPGSLSLTKDMTATSGGALTIEAVIAPTLTNSWVNDGGSFATAGYWKDAFGVVHLQGRVKSGVASSAFTLPSGYRPTASERFVASCNPTSPADVTISSAGDVGLTVTTSVSLDGISFRTT